VCRLPLLHHTGKKSHQLSPPKGTTYITTHPTIRDTVLTPLHHHHHHHHYKPLKNNEKNWLYKKQKPSS
jgi:hypothetical protein